MSTTSNNERTRQRTSSVLLPNSVRTIVAASPSLVTCTGPIYEVPGSLLIARTDLALARMRGLRDLALDVQSDWSSTVLADACRRPTRSLPTPTSMSACWARSRSALLRRWPSCCGRWLFADRAGGFDGFEGAMFSAVRSVQDTGFDSVLDLAGQAVARWGLPTMRDAGAESSVVVDGQGGQLAFATSDAIRAAMGNLSMLRRRPVRRHRRPLLADVADGTAGWQERGRRRRR